MGKRKDYDAVARKHGYTDEKEMLIAGLKGVFTINNLCKIFKSNHRAIDFRYELHGLKAEIKQHRAQQRKKICDICGKPFTVKMSSQITKKICYDPECTKKKNDLHKENMRIRMAEKYVKKSDAPGCERKINDPDFYNVMIPAPMPRTERKCQICGEVLTNGNYFYCNYHHSIISGSYNMDIAEAL